MGPTVFSNTTRPVFYCSHAPHIIWDLQDTTSLAVGFCRCRVCNLATCSSFKCTYNHRDKAKERNEENFQYLARSVASINAHTPVRTAEIWKKILYFFLKAFLSLNWDDG